MEILAQTIATLEMVANMQHEPDGAVERHKSRTRSRAETSEPASDMISEAVLERSTLVHKPLRGPVSEFDGAYDVFLPWLWRRGDSARQHIFLQALKLITESATNVPPPIPSQFNK